MARLLLPADGRPSLVVETDPRWSLAGTLAAGRPDVIVWGRAPAPSGTATRLLAQMAVARERALLTLRLRPPRPYRVRGVHRWPPPRLVDGSARNRLREALLGGVIVELSSGQPPPRLLDAAARAAGYAGRVSEFGAGSGGSALARLRAEAQHRIMRVAQAGQPADPAHAADALECLAPLRIPVVPRLLGRGRALSVSWTLEAELPGRRPPRVSPGIARQVAAICRQLPRASGGPTALRHDLDRIAAAIPDRRRPLMDLDETVSGRLARLPLVMRHGDLWAGNLLVSGDRLTGIVDWDSWHAAAAPGIDLLHLLAADTALRTKREIGEVWLDRPWRSEAFASIAADYWAAIGGRPTAAELDAVGVAWWAAEIGHALALAPEQAQDRRWVGLNVEAVLGSLA
jgi:hypothetical protein